MDFEYYIIKKEIDILINIKSHKELSKFLILSLFFSYHLPNCLLKYRFDLTLNIWIWTKNILQILKFSPKFDKFFSSNLYYSKKDQINLENY